LVYVWNRVYSRWQWNCSDIYEWHRGENHDIACNDISVPWNSLEASVRERLLKKLDFPKKSLLGKRLISQNCFSDCSIQAELPHNLLITAALKDALKKD